MEHLRGFLAKRPDASPDGWVFPSDRVDGPKQYASIMTRKIQPKARSLGLPHVTWRLFRHWHATLLGDASVPIKATRAGELEACPGSWPKIVNIADERKPFIVSEFKLQMSLKENCGPRTKMEMATAGIVAGPGTSTSHFNDVDSHTDTHIGLFPFMWAGLRIVDLRDPARPSEVAYFKPGDACMSHVHYLQKTGQIWFACTYSGFYVVDLKPELRDLLSSTSRSSK